MQAEASTQTGGSHLSTRVRDVCPAWTVRDAISKYSRNLNINLQSTIITQPPFGRFASIVSITPIANLTARAGARFIVLAGFV